LDLITLLRVEIKGNSFSDMLRENIAQNMIPYAWA